MRVLTRLFILVAIATAMAFGQDTLYEGMWSAESGVVLTLERNNGASKGELLLQSRRMPVKAQIEDGVSYGFARYGDTSFSLLIDRVGDQIRLTIDSTAYMLSRRGAQSLPRSQVSRQPADSEEGMPAPFLERQSSLERQTADKKRSLRNMAEVDNASRCQRITLPFVHRVGSEDGNTPRTGYTVLSRTDDLAEYTPTGHD